MKWRKLGIALLMVSVVVTGCKVTTGSKDKSSNSSTTSPVKLQWFSDVGGWNPPLTWSTDPKTVQGEITQKTGVTFEMNIPPQDGATKLSLMLASSSELPDVMSITDGTMIKKLIDAGKVWKIDELIQKYDPNSHLLKNFPSDIKKAIELRDGGWYAYPSHISSESARQIWKPSDQYYIDGVKYRNNGAVMFNTKLMTQAGIKLDDVKTEDGLLAALKKVADMKLTVNGAPVVPIVVDGKSYQDGALQVLIKMFGGMEVDKSGKYRNLLFAPETKHAVDFLNKTVKNGYLDPNVFTIDTNAEKSLVLTGRVFCVLGGTADMGFQEQDFWVSPGPILSNTGEKPVFGTSSKVATGWMQTFISKSTKEPEKVAKWLSFMSSDEGMLLNYYGFEGTDYTLNDKKLVVQTEQGKQDQANSSKTGVFAYWPFHNISFHDSVTQAPTDIKTGVDGIVAMQVQCAFGKSKDTVIYDTAPLALPSNYIAAGSDLANIQTQVKQYKEAQLSKIILAKDDATKDKLYDEMISKLKEIGLDKVDAKIDEQVQKQYKELGVSLKSVN